MPLTLGLGRFQLTWTLDLVLVRVLALERLRVLVRVGLGPVMVRVTIVGGLLGRVLLVALRLVLRFWKANT